MASANVELVQSIVEAWGRGDFGAADWAHPEVEYVVADGPAPGTWKGLAGMAEGTREWLSGWAELRVVVDEHRELDPERVLVLAHFSARGKTSGLELGQIQTRVATVFHVRGGRVTRLVFYMDRDRGLAELGLAPEAHLEGS